MTPGRFYSQSGQESRGLSGKVASTCIIAEATAEKLEKFAIPPLFCNAKLRSWRPFLNIIRNMKPRWEPLALSSNFLLSALEDFAFES